MTLVYHLKNYDRVSARRAMAACLHLELAGNIVLRGELLLNRLANERVDERVHGLGRKPHGHGSAGRTRWKAGERALVSASRVLMFHASARLTAMVSKERSTTSWMREQLPLGTTEPLRRHRL